MEQFALDALKRLTTRAHETYDLIGVDPLTPVIGAEVSGVDLSAELGGKELDEIKRAFLAHHVLVFRDQKLTNEDHKRFARHFGVLHERQLADLDGGDPAVLELSATKDSDYVDGEDWHTDGTAKEEPALGSMLYVTQPPEIGAGGDTLWANMHLAYEMLSPAMKEFLDGLTAIHDGLVPWQGYTPPPEYVVPKSEHPVVAKHPDTGRKMLFVNPGFTTHIVQLARDESRALLDFLFGLVHKPMLSCRVRWTPNTLVFWDNRCTQHHAVWDYYPHARHARRVSINGGRPEA
ncbi:TauD/TfdA dioxygenase family protein [Amycolatopsis sp. CA-230715]|uniref:TauD/TfdA dioxygenase family protein n=1 Tax=Amycolatopsis sp. CA-230715 TaxID=2745196 RepID=UPI001C0392CF|nr:TauD/TfdA family dioxygenase [Amycolatopsis sp. CA-230715]QWF85164.1 Alpha-ketoglutarate-dependent taurine dioxygenase [Amycolatopsis sp. CA-230715]